MKKKKKSRFQIITLIAIWAMIISTVGSLIFSAIVSLIQQSQ